MVICVFPAFESTSIMRSFSSIRRNVRTRVSERQRQAACISRKVTKRLPSGTETTDEPTRWRVSLHAAFAMSHSHASRSLNGSAANTGCSNTSAWMRTHLLTSPSPSLEHSSRLVPPAHRQPRAPRPKGRCSRRTSHAIQSASWKAALWQS